MRGQFVTAIAIFTIASALWAQREEIIRRYNEVFSG